VSPASIAEPTDPPRGSVVASGILLGDKGVLALTWGDARTATCRRLGLGRYQLTWAHRGNLAFFARPWVDNETLVITCRHTRLRTFLDIRTTSGEAVDAHLYIALFTASSTRS
jgi:hypothetical protein